MDQISTFSTMDLALELAKRPDLSGILREDGLIPSDLFSLRAKLGATGTVDSIALKISGDEVIGGVIRRNTGKFAGKLALIGGVVAFNESTHSAIKRHWFQDLGLKVQVFDWALADHCYAPKVDGAVREGFTGEDNTKHSFGMDYGVFIQNEEALTFGSKIGGQEASGFEWYSLETVTGPDDWGYNMHSQFVKLLTRANTLYRYNLLR